MASVVHAVRHQLRAMMPMVEAVCRNLPANRLEPVEVTGVADTGRRFQIEVSHADADALQDLLRQLRGLSYKPELHLHALDRVCFQLEDLK